VNMRYQEEKIHRVANALKRFYNSDVTLEDCRDSSTGSRNIVARAFYSKSLEYLNVPLLDEKSYQHSISGSNNPIRMRITKEGGIYIKLSERRESDEFKQYLLSHGFKQVHSIGKNELLLPIIDQGMQEDRDQFLESVRGYYRGIIDLNTGVFAGRPDIAAKVFAADNKEFGDASCGLFEYYTDPKIVMGMLQARGFVNIGYQSDSKGIWCNITAQKS